MLTIPIPAAVATRIQKKKNKMFVIQSFSLFLCLHPDHENLFLLPFDFRVKLKVNTKTLIL